MATEANASDAQPKKGKGKLFIILGVVLVLLIAAGAGAFLFMKKQKAHDEEEDPAAAETHKAQLRDPAAKPVFLPLDQFTVNLADRDADRYAQITLTLELSEEKRTDQVKNFMPIIRNNILMVLSHKTALEMLSREGQENLAAEIRAEVARAMGLAEPKGTTKSDKISPVIAVHFQSFIVQ